MFVILLSVNTKLILIKHIYNSILCSLILFYLLKNVNFKILLLLNPNFSYTKTVYFLMNIYIE